MKDALRATLEGAIREDAAIIQANPAVSDDMKRSIGLPVYKTTRTPVPAPTTTPMFQKVDTSVRGVLNLFIADSTTPNKRAKPAGVDKCEFREQIGSTAPTDPESMPFLATVGRTPYMVNFDATDVGRPSSLPSAGSTRPVSTARGARSTTPWCRAERRRVPFASWLRGCPMGMEAEGAGLRPTINPDPAPA